MTQVFARFFMLPAVPKLRMAALAALVLMASPVAMAGSKMGDALAFQKESRGASLRIFVAEDVGAVALESRKTRLSPWKRSLVAANATGSREIVLPLTSTLRTQELRVVVSQLRPLPTTLSYSRSASNKTVTVKRPALGTKMSLEVLDTATKTWKRLSVAEQTLSGSDVTIPIPSEYRNAAANALRVVALDRAKPKILAPRFPAVFRAGKTEFPGQEITQSAAIPDALPVAAAPALDKSATTPVEEADIWRVLGKKIYFFNQLRGLQVIDTSDPKNPVIASSLRMPAVGEEMYVLQDNLAVLVRHDYSGNQKTFILLVDASQPQAAVIGKVELDGWYVDSRLLGGRLVVATQSWDSTTYTEKSKISVIENLSTAPSLAASTDLDRNTSLMGATADYIWVAGYSNNSWSQSSLTLFPVTDLPSLTRPITFDLGGSIYDKFKVHQNGDALFAVTQNWNSNWRGVTKLESYSLAGGTPQLSTALTLVEGESLHATRFDGSRAYVVTFHSVDPLWIIDLSDAANPRIESQLQVAGWSSYIQPLGDYLAAVGVEGGKVTATLFDVHDPENPALASRATIGDDGWTWSEANWNEKAVAILPDQNLILLPYHTYSWGNGSTSAVQILDMDLTAGTLAKRGVIAHAFEPRRATALEQGLLASISNRELLLVDATNRDTPALVSDVTLAFGADCIVFANEKYIVHAEGGDWNGGSATLRVSDAADPENVLAESILPASRILAADTQGGRITLLVQNPQSPAASSVVVFNANTLPQLNESGRVSVNLSVGYATSASILWPNKDTAVISLCDSGWGWWYRYPVVYATAGPSVVAAAPVLDCRPWWGGCAQDSIQLLAIDFSSSAPRLASTLKLDTLKPVNTSSFFAGDGLVVFSADQAQQEALTSSTTIGGVIYKTASLVPRTMLNTQLRVVDYADPAAPFFWPAASIPGRLEGIADWDRSAGILFTSHANTSGGITLDALLFEAGVAASITSTDLAQNQPFAFFNRSLYSADATTLNRCDLTDRAAFTPAGSLTNLPWSPSEISVRSGSILLRSGSEIGVTGTDLSLPAATWSLSGWSWQLDEARSTGNAWAVPLGDYGIELLK